MLSKAERLSTKEIGAVISAGLETHSVFFVTKRIPAAEFKFSPVAPKKIFKTAVLRNRTRRRVYAAVREVLSGKRPRQNHVAIILKKNIAELDSERLMQTIEDAFVKAGIIA